MNRGEAYAALAAELAAQRQEGHLALAVRVGQPAHQKIVQLGQESVVIETSVHWADQKKQKLRIVATAAGPSCWKLDRLEESIQVGPDL